MQANHGVASSARALSTDRTHIAAWNRRLLIAATVLVLWGATALALYAAGPHARAMIAGEGILYTDPL